MEPNERRNPFRKLLDPDFSLWIFLTRCVDLILLSILFALCCVPLVTVGTSAAALCYGVRRCVIRQKGSTVAGFLRGLRLNAKYGILFTILALIPAGLVFELYHSPMLGGVNSLPGLLRIFLIVVAIHIGSGICVLIPLISRHEMTFPGYVHAAAMLSDSHPIRSRGLLLAFLAGAFFTWVFPVLILILPGLLALLSVTVLDPVFDKHMDAPV